MTEKVPFWLKPSKLLVLSVMPFGGKNYVTNIVTGKAVMKKFCKTVQVGLLLGIPVLLQSETYRGKRNSFSKKFVAFQTEECKIN